MTAFESPACYEICLLGRLDEKWLAWLEGVQSIHTQEQELGPFTILTCTMIDQARLRGLLNQLWDLNLTLVSVKRLAGAAPEA